MRREDEQGLYCVRVEFGRLYLGTFLFSIGRSKLMSGLENREYGREDPLR
jgi:hypothetical protein